MNAGADSPPEPAGLAVVEVSRADERREERSEALRIVLWFVTFLTAVFGGLGPAVKVMEDFRGGYFGENDYSIAAVLSTMALTVFLSAWGLLNLVLGTRIPLREFVAALVIHLATIGIGYGIIDVTFSSVVKEAVSRSQAVADAIHAFARARGRPPRELSELVPEFLVDPEPERLFASGPFLDYAPTSAANGPRAGAFELGTFALFNPIHLEYAPDRTRREAAIGEHRIGDWIVDAHCP